MKTNLQAGKIRLIFVADVIPKELQRIVEFLNEQMDPAEVLAVELRQYVGAGTRSLVPRLVGRTAEAEAKKQSPEKKAPIVEEEFLERLEAARGESTVKQFRSLLAWGEANGMPPKFSSGSFSYRLGDRSILNCSTSGDVWLYIGGLCSLAPFNDDGKWKEFAARLTSIAGVTLDDRNPNQSRIIENLAHDETTQSLTSLLDSAFQEVRGAQRLT